MSGGGTAAPRVRLSHVVSMWVSALGMREGLEMDGRCLIAFLEPA